jgi:hypothetical protein
MKAKFYIHKVTSDTVFIVDEDGPMSITNDAEAVVEYINSQYPSMRIVYCDTDGHWDELVHTNGNFLAFEPIGTFLKDM